MYRDRDVPKKRIAVIASGRGSNFQAVIDGIASGFIPAVCVGLITDNPSAYAIERAKQAGIPVTVVDFREFRTKQEYEDALLAAMRGCEADLFVLAGYMRILGQQIVHVFSGRMMNIHPALLPAFSGLHAQRQAVEYRGSGIGMHRSPGGRRHGHRPYRPAAVCAGARRRRCGDALRANPCRRTPGAP